MAVTGGFVVGTCSYSCQDIIDASQDIVMQVPPPATGGHIQKKKKKKKMKNQIISK